MSINKKRILRVSAGFLCAVTIASTETLVYAEPSTKELEEKTSNLQGELDSMNSNLASLGAQLDEASAKSEQMSEKVEKAKLDLAAAKLNEESQYESMKERIKFMYEGGNISLFQILLTSESMTDFLNKAEYVSNISEYDRDMLDEFEKVCKDVEKKQEKLKKQQEELSSLQKDLSQKRDNLSAQISSTSGELSDYSAQLARAKAAEEALKTAQDDSVSGNTGEESNSEKSEPKKSNTTQSDTGTKKPSKDDSKNDSGSSTENSGGSTSASTSDVALLAAILECEAGSSYDGMIAVGTVIMNRVASSKFPNTIKGVVYQSGQFSPTWNGFLDKVLARGPSSSAYSAAKAVLGGTRHSKVKNCLYFNAAWTGHDGVNVGGNVFW